MKLQLIYSAPDPINYKIGRHQMHDSDHKITNCDTPQGFILGPSLFILDVDYIVNTALQTRQLYYLLKLT